MIKGKRYFQGFALTAMTAALATIAFIFVLGYSTYYAKRANATLLQNQKTYLYEAKLRMLEAYAANVGKIDSDLEASAFRDGDTWLALAGIPKKWGLKVDVSDRLEKNNLKYTAIALWLPTEHDDENPPSFDPATGIFTNCSTAPCPDRAFTTFDGFGIQVEAQNKTQELMNSIAAKAQAYFKARNLNDVEHNISVNYFRAPNGCGSSGPEDIPCINTLTSLDAWPAVSKLIGLDSQTLKNAWGLDIEISNLEDSRTPDASDPTKQQPPFTMVFRTKNPWGGEASRIYAVQPI